MSPTGLAQHGITVASNRIMTLESHRLSKSPRYEALRVLCGRARGRVVDTDISGHFPHFLTCVDRIPHARHHLAPATTRISKLVLRSSVCDLRPSLPCPPPTVLPTLPTPCCIYACNAYRDLEHDNNNNTLIQRTHHTFVRQTSATGKDLES